MGERYASAAPVGRQYAVAEQQRGGGSPDGRPYHLVGQGECGGHRNVSRPCQCQAFLRKSTGKAAERGISGKQQQADQQRQVRHTASTEKQPQRNQNVGRMNGELQIPDAQPSDQAAVEKESANAAGDSARRQNLNVVVAVMQPVFKIEQRQRQDCGKRKLWQQI